jgi:hypothetical protein
MLSCSSGEKTATGTPETFPKLLGVWELKSRVHEGDTRPATEQFWRLTFFANGRFHARFKGTPDGEWIAPGNGGYRCTPPALELYWDSGRVLRLQIQFTDDTHMLVHHGPVTAVYKDQLPDEIFERVSEAAEKSTQK